ncbi:MAG TPA: glycosyltransferase family 39 protein [bacterium]|nr:glycosyltransferase family 39 protein [bacterium]
MGLNSFWDDEARTAIESITLLNTGKISGWNGRNFIGIRDGALLRDDFTLNYPPVQFYITAAAFDFFGINEFNGRIFFVVFGILSYIYLLKLTIKISGLKTASIIPTAAISILTISYYLYIRQCRYYSPAIFFTIAAYYHFNNYFSRCSNKDLWSAFIFSELLFFTHYLNFVCLIAAFVFIFPFYNNSICLLKKNIKKILFIILIFSVPVFYHALKYKIWLRPDIPSDTFIFTKVSILFIMTIRDVNNLNFFSIPVFLVGAYFILLRRNFINKFIRLFVFVLIYIILNSILSPQPVIAAEYSDIRYLSPLIPFFILLNALIFIELINISNNKTIIYFFIFMIFFNNRSLLVAGKNNGDAFFSDYLYEIFNDYETGYEAAVKYLQQIPGSNIELMVKPELHCYPLMFKLNDKILFSGQVEEMPRLDISKIPNFRKSVFIKDSYPDKILLFGRENICDTIQHNNIEYFLETIIPVAFGDDVRPELFWHSFRKTVNIDIQKNGIYVYSTRKPD